MKDKPSVQRKGGLVKSAISARGFIPLDAEYDWKERAIQLERINERPVKIRTYARRLQINVKREGLQTKPPTSHRGVIKEFSRKSRKRMLDLCHSIRNVDERAMWFITLTYPNEFTWTAKQVKEHLRALVERFKRKYEGYGLIWRLELKTRLTGAMKGFQVPHYHIILFNVFAQHKPLREWVSKAWHEIVGSGEVDHLKAGTNVRRVKSFAHMVNYVSKYAAKADDDADIMERNWGRRWGSRGNLDCVHLHTIRLTQRQYVHWHRLMRRYLRALGHGHEKTYTRIGSWRGASIYDIGDQRCWLIIRQITAHARQLAADEAAR